ncbi:uncharacterized protein LOC116769718 [Danaus plexippus]|uniref:Uncharacterized protein n=1 Tax=Danaus plexippus plexippus TaxID=278856 RepID=A0A212FAC9_DANPL|nr:uncharacterized protein LOC116769718 [Danaus plexippus]OWR50696.1 hypothetical protein KGM_212281 [Danaus plexippus plexippus]
MDYTKIPHFALFRQACTVIVRVRMDLVDTFGCMAAQMTDHPRCTRRPSTCEKCSRTRSISKYSDCDSDLVDKNRRYRASAARSRYVNVCAAVCLVLLVGSLSPQTAAAPHKRSMDSSEENVLWGNPCDYNSNQKSTGAYTADLAKKVALQAKSAYDSTAKYKDEFAYKLHSYERFNDLLQMWSSNEWLRNFTWFPEEGLPKDKVLYQRMSDAYMDKLMKQIDKVLPSMYKGLKMVVAGLDSIRQDFKLNSNIPLDSSLERNIMESMHEVRAVLCYFNDMMRSRDLQILPLPNTEVPNIKDEDRLSYALLVYRDTLNYLEYLNQVFQKMYDEDSLKAK